MADGAYLVATLVTACQRVRSEHGRMRGRGVVNEGLGGIVIL